MQNSGVSGQCELTACTENRAPGEYRPEDRAGGCFEKRACARVQGPPGRQVAPGTHVGLTHVSFTRLLAAPAGLEHQRLRRRRGLCAGETRHKPCHVHAGGATGGPWRGLLRVSPARASGRRRRQRVRMYGTVAPGGPQGVSALACAGPHFLRFRGKLGLGRNPNISVAGGSP